MMPIRHTSAASIVRYSLTMFIRIRPLAVAFSFALLLGCGGADTGSSEAPAEEASESADGGGQDDRVSPHEAADFMVGQANIQVTYGRPYVKGREIYGGLVPLGEVWRTGADEATTLETDRDLMLGSLHVPAGKYGLFTIPGESEWTLIVNTVHEQWGAFKYDESMDLGRVAMSVGPADETEQLTIGIDAEDGSANGTLSITWATTTASLGMMAH